MFQPRRRTALKASAALLGAPLVLASCGDGPAGGGDPDGDLVVWFPGTNPAEQAFINDVLVPAYTESTGRNAAVTFIDWGDMSTRLNAGFSSGTGPDVYGHGPAAVADLVGYDRALPLDEYIDQMDPAEIEDLSAALESGIVDNVHYMFPIASTGRHVGFNAAHAEAAGLDPDAPPASFAELREWADQLVVRDGDQIERAGIVFDARPESMQQAFTTLLWSNGGEMFTEDGTEVLFSEPEGVEALEWYADLYQGPSPVDNNLGGTWDGLPPAQSPLITEDTSMLFSNPSTFTQIMEAAPELDLRIMDVLPFDDGEPAAFGGAATGVMINPDSSRIDAAWEFIQMIGDPELNNQYAEDVGHVPVHASAIESEYVQETPAVAATVENADYFRSNPNIPAWTRVRDTLAQYIEQALSGQATAQEALDQAAAEVEQILAEEG